MVLGGWRGIAEFVARLDLGYILLGFGDGITNHGSPALQMREAGVHIVSKPITAGHKQGMY